MAWPEGLTLVTVRISVATPPDGGVVTGSARFTTAAAMINPALDPVVPPLDKLVRLAPDGTALIRLPANNQPGWSPVGQAYSVTLAANGYATVYGTLALDHAQPDIQLSSHLVITAPNAVIPGQTYALASHTHTIDDVADLQVQLDGKQPAGEYLTAADIDNLVSDETLDEAINTRLPKIGPTVVDSFFRVQRSAGGGAQWRTDGDALDVEFVGDVIESRRANQDFTGAQVDIRRVRGDGQTLVGLTEFGSGPYAAEQRIDSRTGQGVAYLGGKNSAGNVALAGYLDIDTAPVSGTWATGDVVLTRAGHFRCIVGGTPGTWRWLNQSVAVDRGFAGWMGDPGNIQAGTIITTGGTPYVFRFRAQSAVVSSMALHLTIPGSGLTNAYWTLHNDAGAILGPGAKSADQSVNLQTGGERTMALNVGQAVTPGAYYRARFWVTGSALPTVSRLCNSSSAAINAGGVLSWASAAGGLTDAASAPDDIGSLTGIATAWWAGFKP